MPAMAQIHTTFSSLGTRQGDTYTMGDDCLAKLNEIISKLATEDHTLHTYRRAIGFGQNIRKDLIPLLMHVKDDTKVATKIIDATIKILVDLTIPVEYLLPIETVSRTDVGRHTIFELNKLLSSGKEAFVDSRSTKAVMDHIKFVVESDLEMDALRCDSINNCLLLIRNILYVPEIKMVPNCPLAHSSRQNQIIWNLFTQHIDKVIIYLMSCPRKIYWSVTMVQLIALLYKDQHVGTLQKLLNLWLEASLSESSDDNESNTSPLEQGSDDCSQVITSDPTSDSSDNGSSDKNKNKTGISTDMRGKCPPASVMGQNRNKSLAELMRGKSTDIETSSGVSSMNNSIDFPNDPSGSDKSPMPTVNGKKRDSSQSEDFGYVTQMENPESISTSSNEEDQPHQKPVHQKPHSFQKTRWNSSKRAVTALEKKELRRKKLVKRSKTTIINMKGLMHHLPTDEDIANILKEFTVDFLLKSYGTLVYDLHSQLISNIHHVQIDTSHFFWLVTYFLKFATQLELDLEHVGPVLSLDILSFLVFQGVWVQEELEISKKIPDADLKPCLRRLHLVVTAIREFLQALQTYQKMTHLSEEDRIGLAKLQMEVRNMADLRLLFLLLLRKYSPAIQSKQYLQDLILTNHSYLLLLDGATEHQHPINMMEHLKQFATVEIMRQYGLLLEDYKENGEFVNNCVFTMMHHIGGDLEYVHALFQPAILKTFSKIWDTDYEICDDWLDLIEYIMHKFINKPRPDSDFVNVMKEERLGDDAETASNEWTAEDKDNLLNYYSQSRYYQDAIGNITKKYEKGGVKQKTQLSIIRQLLEQNIISSRQYEEFIRERNPNEIGENPETGKNLLDLEESLVDSDLKVLREYLCTEDKGQFVSWLQEVLIETCYIKLVQANPAEFKDPTVLGQAVTYYFALLNMPIPLVPWTTEQNNILNHQPFVLLLHKLGLYLPIDTGKIFVTIPNFWNAEQVFSIAQQLGPIDSTKLKFDVQIFKGNDKRGEVFREEIIDVTNTVERAKFSMGHPKQTPTMVRYTPLPNPTEWFQTNTSHSRVIPILDFEVLISSTHRLSITIPETEQPICSPLSSGLSTVYTHHSSAIMECSPIHDDIERNSFCETASIASDLTRMCVSDEEEKLELVIEKNAGQMHYS